MPPYDVAIIGGGHNGLVAGVLLARAGLEVVVLESNPEPGGCVWTETLPSGHRLELGAVDHSQILGIAEELGLGDFGLLYNRRKVAVGAAFGDGKSLLFPVESDQLDEALRATGDVGSYRGMSDLGAELFSLMDSFAEPPSLTTLAAALDAMPGGDELMRILINSADSVLSERLTDPHLISAVAMYGSHSQVPSFMPGTGLFAFMLPASHDESPARPVGGSVALINALVAALEAADGNLLVGAKVVGVSDTGGRREVHLADGTSIEAQTVVSTLDVRRTVALLSDPPREMQAAAERAHDGSLNVGEIKIDVALGERPALGVLDRAPEAIWMVQAETDSLRRSYGDVLAGRIPSSPAFMWAAPSESDSSAAPVGGAVIWMSAFMPLRPANGQWTDEMERTAATRILDGFVEIVGVDLRQYASTVRVNGPTAWRQRLGSETGNPNHLDLTLDQMFGWRPVGMAGHRTPAGWLYLSGAGTHPGGGLSGLPGKNAALAVLEDVDGRRRSQGGNRLKSLRAALKIYRSMRK